MPYMRPMAGASFLIVAALIAAVASFLVPGTQWLLFVSAALVFGAFYLSRRASKSIATPNTHTKPPARPHVHVAIDHNVPLPSGRHRTDGTDTSTDDVATDLRDDFQHVDSLAPGFAAVGPDDDRG